MRILAIIQWKQLNLCGISNRSMILCNKHTRYLELKITELSKVSIAEKSMRQFIKINWSNGKAMFVNSFHWDVSQMSMLHQLYIFVYINRSTKSEHNTQNPWVSFPSTIGYFTLVNQYQYIFWVYSLSQYNKQLSVIKQLR